MPITQDLGIKILMTSKLKNSRIQMKKTWLKCNALIKKKELRQKKNQEKTQLKNTHYINRYKIRQVRNVEIPALVPITW